ncbi:MAG: serine/threonine protein kinase [Planctomycetes bacterium]|nr:serine/threonine protein kinase [Planctomycetota bacterium]
MSEISSGQVLGNVRLDKFLGEGAMGVVYQGHHLTLGLNVAVKVLKIDSANGVAHRYTDRFRREAQLAARLNHPGIVRVLDFGDKDGVPYMVMELVDGFSFEEYLRRRDESVNETTVQRVLLAVANALVTAHDEGIIHRDLKPANLLLNRKGVLKIADLGLAKEDGGAALTREKVMVGSPAFMSPESLTPGVTVDYRCDLYSLGVIGYQLAFGQLPYSGTMVQVANGHLGGKANFGLPTSCGKPTIAIIKKLMQPQREQRYQHAREIVADIRRIITGAHSRGKTGSSSSATGGNGSGSSASDFRNIVGFLESRLGGTSSEVDGKTVVHTTTRERVLVWLMLIGMFGVAIVGFVLFGGDGKPAAKSTATTPTETPVPPTPAVPPVIVAPDAGTAPAPAAVEPTAEKPAP